MLLAATDRHPGSQSDVIRRSQDSDNDGSDSKDNHSTGTNEEDNAIAKHESIVVGRLKVVVALVLIVSTVAVTAIVYEYLSRSEVAKFHERFKDDAYKVFASIGANMDKTFGVLDAAALTLVSHAKETNQTWPFVTMPSFGIHMAKLLLLTDVPVIGFLPIVTPHNRREWETYASEHDDWVNECVSVQKTWKWYRGPLDHHEKKIKTIHVSGEVLPSNHRCVYGVHVWFYPFSRLTRCYFWRTFSRDMLPLWQNFPVVPNVRFFCFDMIAHYTLSYVVLFCSPKDLLSYNSDWLSTSPVDAYRTCLTSMTATISKAFLIPTP
jgi:hypothetical protein